MNFLIRPDAERCWREDDFAASGPFFTHMGATAHAWLTDA
jgi:hypothetical protein